MLHVTSITSPIGPLSIAARDERLCLLHFGGDSAHVRRTLARWYPGQAIERHSDPAGTVAALRRYFGGEVSALDGIEVELNGTPFQRRVWEALRNIRAGSTCSYSELARTIGAQSAVRAVGTANGANPVAIVVPCHRVIGADGGLTGYGGGLERKRWLLQHEGVLLV